MQLKTQQTAKTESLLRVDGMPIDAPSQCYEWSVTVFTYLIYKFSAKNMHNNEVMTEKQKQKKN